MKKTASILTLLIGLAVLGGCASTGNQQVKAATQQSVAAQIKEGVTTKAQLTAALGDPSSVSFTDSGNEIWTYKYSEATSHATNFIPLVGLLSSGADVKSKEIVVLLDKNGVVSKYTMRETKEVTRSGLLGKQ